MRPIMKVKRLEIYQKVFGLPSFEEVHSYERSRAWNCLRESALGMMERHKSSGEDISPETFSGALASLAPFIWNPR